MQSYQLRNKIEDELFLQAQPINCPAAMTKSELQKLIQQPRIMVLLSNGKKYSAVIKEHQLRRLGQTFEGHITIQRITAVV